MEYNYFEDIKKYFDDEQIDIFKEAIKKALNGEVFFGVDEDNRVYPIFYGNDDSVIVDDEIILKYNLIVHNHPSGNLKPSVNDNAFASYAAKNGIGFAIINNEVTQIYFVVPTTSTQKFNKIELNEIDLYLTEVNKNIKKIICDFKKRDSQIQMAKSILNSINNSEKIVIEGNTGIGKSFAYLVPFILNIKYNKQRFLITTSTISLQRQLMEKDIPSILKIMGIDITYDYLIGRNNYLCLFRYKLLKEKEVNSTIFYDDLEYLDLLDKFIETTDKGILDELDSTILSKIKNEINSHSAICLRESCKFYSKCFYYNSRKKLSKCDLIVLNNNLFLLNELSEDSAEFLPKSKYVVFDEAHNLENCMEDVLTLSYESNYIKSRLNYFYNKKENIEIGFIFFVKQKFLKMGKNLNIDLFKDILYNLKESTESFIESTSYIFNLLSEIENKNLENKNKLNKIESITLGMDDICQKLESFKLNFYEIIENYYKKIKESIERFENFYNNELLKNIEKDEDQTLFIKKNLEFFLSYLKTSELIFSNFLSFDINDYFEKDQILWVTLKRDSAVFNYLPLDNKQLLATKIYDSYKTILFTSATLTIDKNFDYFLNTIGLGNKELFNIKTEIYDSPFNYKENAELMIVKDSPDPNSKDFLSFVCNSIEKILMLSNGNAFILTTSYYDLNYIYDFLLNSRLNEKLTILAQNKMYNNNKILEIFKNTINSVLIGTLSFWEGIDVPGRALELIIITKLPFQVPSSPVLKFKSKKLENEKKNSFYELSLPYAAIKLKQGFGRLIRKETDIGVCFIFDNRIKTKAYGKQIINTLPEMNLYFDNFENLYINYNRFLKKHCRIVNN